MGRPLCPVCHAHIYTILEVVGNMAVHTTCKKKYVEQKKKELKEESGSQLELMPSLKLKKDNPQISYCPFCGEKAKRAIGKGIHTCLECKEVFSVRTHESFEGLN